HVVAQAEHVRGVALGDRLARRHHAPVVADDGDARGRGRGLDAQQRRPVRAHRGNRYLTTSLRSANSISVTTMTRPTYEAIARARRDGGRRVNSSRVKNISKPPSRIGTGRK